MKIRPLVLSAEVNDDIARLIQYAKRNVFSLDELKRMIKTGSRIGDEKDYAISIPFGYRVVYSLEEQVFGLTHHLSMSVDEIGALPSIIAVQTMTQKFGFPLQLLGGCLLETENNRAIRVMCPVDPAKSLEFFRATAGAICPTCRLPPEKHPSSKFHPLVRMTCIGIPLLPHGVAVT